MPAPLDSATPLANAAYQQFSPRTPAALATPVTLAYGDGIGPEIMRATLAILEAAGARIAPEVIDIGEREYLSGNLSGIPASAWESLRRTRVFLKAPITTPSGKGYKSLNVTIRKTLGLYANVRPCVSYAPFVATDFRAEGQGRDQVLTFTTHVDDEAVAGPDHPIRVVRDPATGEPSPYVHIRANLEALIDRKTFYRLVDLCCHEPVDGESWFGLWSSGRFFPVIPSADLP